MARPQPVDSLLLWIEFPQFGGRSHVAVTARLPGGRRYPFAPRPRADIDAANDELVDRVDDFSLDVYRWASLDPQVKNRHLNDIEAAGRKLAEKMFGDQLPNFVNLVKQYRPRRLEIEVLDEAFSPLLDLIRILDAGKEIYLGEVVTVTSGFDGGVLQFEQPSANAMEDEFVMPLKEFAVGLAEDSSLPSACRDRSSTARAAIEEIYALRPIVSDLSDVDILRSLDPTSREDGLEELNQWLHPLRRVVHFNCHGISAGRGRNDDPNIQITEKFSFDKDDLHDRDLSFALVTLNVCNSAVGTYSSRKTLAQAFHDQNAMATVCTTGAVDDRFATDFACELYARLAGADLLTAMHDTRRELLRRHQHPMSLMYTFTGEGAFRLDKI